MSDHAIDILLRAKDQASKTIRGVNNELSRTGRVAAIAGRGAQTTARNLAGLGAIAFAGIGLAVKTGLDDLAALETATTSVDGAIKQLGLTGQVTSAQVATWANDIEASIGAAFDDKDITAATATLIRFGKVTPTNLRPAMQVMTDLAVKTGSVQSASALLAKALADPAKAAGKLARAGVVLTKSQQDEIKALMKAGKVAAAQKVILDALAKTTKDAALASQGPYARAMSLLADASEDARKALAEGFLPVIEKVAGKLSKLLADPKAIQSIRDFGNGLAGVFDKAVDFADKVPWGTIGQGLKTAAEWSKRLFDVFLAMPPEVQTTLVALAGLNKLSGGAVSGIIGELGKGLVKGVLGMNAGVVNINAATVNGGGGIPGAAAPAAGGAAATAGGVGAGTILTAVLAIPAAILIANAIKSAAGISDTENTDRQNHGQFGPRSSSNVPVPVSVKGHVMLGGQSPNVNPNTGFVIISKEQKAMTSAIERLNRAQASGNTKWTAIMQGRLDRLKQAQADQKRAVETTGSTTKAKLGDVMQASSVHLNQLGFVTSRGTAGTTAATNTSGSRIVGAIQANRPVVTTSVVVNVSAASVSKSTTVQERYGPGNGSGGSGSNGAPKPT